MPSKPNNIVSLPSGYRFSDEPETSLLYQVRIAINNSNLPYVEIQRLIFQSSGRWMAEQTIANLMNGKTKSPHLRTVSLIMRALGYRLTWQKRT